MQTYTDTAYHTFIEDSKDELKDKEFLLVGLGTKTNSAKIATSGDVAIAVIVDKRDGDPAVNARLLGKGGTVKVKAGGIIPKGSRVVWGTGGTVIAQPTTVGTHRTLGRKLTQGSSADGDIIEILDIIETITIES